ncbi:MAG: NACHT domain-containing protein [Gammaproteobacteria bacterium]|nr:NACHT domain-containing protein [Gammaproteobacteria bacterium]
MTQENKKQSTSYSAVGENNTLFPPPEPKDRANLLILLKEVRQFWIEGVLENTTLAEHHLILMETRPQEVEPPWRHAIEQKLAVPQLLPLETKINELFEQTEHLLLILGELNSGKTTTLLELTRNLLDQAENSSIQPVPVVFNLHSWAEKRLPIRDWLVEELKSKYFIPGKLAQKWLDEIRILPLLDGLDEVNTKHRRACLSAINSFMEKNLSGMVVCSGFQEYLSLPRRLKLNAAIRLQRIPVIPTRLQLYQQGLPHLLDNLHRAGYKFGMAQRIDTHHLLEQLAALDKLPKDSAGLQAFLAPVLCHTAEEQARFSGFFSAWSRQVENDYMSYLPNLVESALGGDTDFEFAPGEGKSSLWQKLRRSLDLPGFKNWKGLIKPAIWGLFFLAGLGIVIYFTPKLLIEMPSGGNRDAMLPLLITILFLYPLWWLLKFLWHALRDGFLARHATYLKPGDLTTFYLKGERAELFHSAALARDAQYLRRHRETPNRRLDIVASLRKTIHAGGWFSPMWGQDKQVPEYLVLIDRLSFRDHQAHFAESLLHQLDKEEVALHRYYFDADPRYCYPADGDKQAQEKAKKDGELPAQQLRGYPLIELLERHDNHRLLIFSDGSGLFDDGRPAAWLENLCRLQQPALFTLAAPDTRRLRKTLLKEQGLAIFPANPDGLSAFTRYLDTGLHDEGNSGDGAHLPSLLVRTPPMQWVSHITPARQIQQDLVQQLRDTLGDGWQWFSACALYPELRWPLTLELGERLLKDTKKLKAQLPKLTCLPWFRYGSMPNWLRLAVIHNLDRKEEKTLRAVLDKLMGAKEKNKKNKSIIDFWRNLKLKAHKKTEQPKDGIPMEAGQLSLWERLKQRWHPTNNELRDTVLLDFVENHLAVRIGRELRRFLKTAHKLTNSVFVSKKLDVDRKEIHSYSQTELPPDAKSTPSLVELREHEGRGISAAFSQDARRVVMANEDNTALLWDAESGTILAELRGHEGSVISVAFSLDARRVVTASEDNTARLWDAESGAILAELRGHEGSVISAAFSPDARRVVTASDDNTARLWDAESGAILAELRGHKGGVISAAFSPDARQVVTTSEDNTARLWDAESGAILAELRGHEGGVISAAFSPDARRVVTASEDNTARLWDVESGAILAELRGHEGGVISAAFSPDARRVVTASEDNTARLWDAESGAILAELRGHEGKVMSAAFSPDARQVVTAASGDNTARLWDAESSAILAKLHGHEGGVISAAFSADSHRLMTASRDKTARLWDAISGKLLTVMKQEGLYYLYEAKLFLVGEGGAGKTSLARKIADSEATMPEADKSTRGIDITRWEFPIADSASRTDNANTFRINICDFGGQQIYYATHQFFLTKRSLYILVADTRRDDTDFYDWLNQVELLSDGSPVVIVKNNKDDRPVVLDEASLRERFSNLEATFNCNVRTGEGLNKILDFIRYRIQKLPHVGLALPKSWLEVRQILEADPRNTIVLQEYLDICRQHAFKNRQDALKLSEYLHDLGVFLHFQYDDLLVKIIMLKPAWAIDAVYKVLDSDKVKNGRFSRADLKEIWHEEKYADMHLELLRLMINFKLCYELPEAGHYIVPQLLSRQKPEYAWDDADNLLLRYSYSRFMPAGILARFIVAVHPLIANSRECVWRHGVVLYEDNTRAEVREELERREIRIRINGNHKRDMLTTLTYELEKIHRSLSRLEYKQEIPCNCDVCTQSREPHFYDYNMLKRFRDDRQTTAIQCQASFQMVDIRKLLEAVKYNALLLKVKKIAELREKGSSIEERVIDDIPYLSIQKNIDGILSEEIIYADQPEISQKSIKLFVDKILATYPPHTPGLLIYGHGELSDELRVLAQSKRIRLQSYMEYQGLLDFSNYVKKQTQTLASDSKIYPPALYVRQLLRGKLDDSTEEKAAYETVRAWLDDSTAHFILILGEFGTGKTFFLRELTRRLGEDGSLLVPVLLQMRGLEKTNNLYKLIAQQLADYDMAFDSKKFRYMLEQGHIVLLFDGFDELALRVTYDKATEYFNTILEAAQGEYAKVVVTARTQHFISDRQIKQHLWNKAESIHSRRIVFLTSFNREQIFQFLRNKFVGDRQRVEKYLHFIETTNDLMGLAANPWMLNFIAELPEKSLDTVQQGGQKITAAKLYEILLESWLRGEHHRTYQGYKDDLSLENRWQAVTALALNMWEQGRLTVNVEFMTETLRSNLDILLDVHTLTHQIGSGTWLVRDEDGNFSFIHRSVMEWLVAKAAADEVRAWLRESRPVQGLFSGSLAQHQISPLMADFFKDLVGYDLARQWSEAVLQDKDASETVKINALKILQRF